MHEKRTARRRSETARESEMKEKECDIVPRRRRDYNSLRTGGLERVGQGAKEMMCK